MKAQLDRQMKTYLKTLGAIVVLIMGMAVCKCHAQTDTNAVPGTNSLFGGPIDQVISFVTTGSNWFVVPYGIATTEGDYGAGLALGYKLSDFVVPTLRLDALQEKGQWEVWMPSASLQLQAPVKILGKLTVIPFGFAGIATPVAGKGADNGTAVGIFGAGGAVHLTDKIFLAADYEKWSGFEGHQIRFGVGFHF